MLEGFIIGLLLWTGPAIVAWLLVGPARLTHRLRHHN